MLERAYGALLPGSLFLYVGCVMLCFLVVFFGGVWWWSTALCVVHGPSRLVSFFITAG